MSGLLLCIVESVDKFRDTGIFCPPQIYGSKHGDYVGTLEPTTVSGKQVDKIPRVNMGLKGVRVSETPDPSIFNDLEDEGPVSHFAGLDEQLGGEPGGPFMFHIFPESVGGIFFDAGVVRLVGADHAVEAHGFHKQAFVGCIGEY